MHGQLLVTTLGDACMGKGGFASVVLQGLCDMYRTLVTVVVVSPPT